VILVESGQTTGQPGDTQRHIVLFYGGDAVTVPQGELGDPSRRIEAVHLKQLSSRHQVKLVHVKNIYASICAHAYLQMDQRQKKHTKNCTKTFDWEDKRKRMIKERLGVVDKDTDDDSGSEGEKNEVYEDDGEKIGNASKDDDDDDDDDDAEGHQHQKCCSNRETSRE